MSSKVDPTFVVELTPAGRAAVAVMLVDGPEAVRAVGECFAPASGRAFEKLPLGRIVLGRWGGSDGEELIACRRSAHQFEIHCHGGTAAVQAIVEALGERGCKRLSWRDWLLSPRGRISPPTDLTSPKDATMEEAQIALAEATTAHAAAVLLAQYDGALSQAIHAALDAIAAGDRPRAAAILEGVLRFRDLGLHLTAPWRVVLAGPPNVGKSSLINALAGYNRSIVSPQPGTTRDVVTIATAIAGWPVELADTAGLRSATDRLEATGIALAANALGDADLVVVVHDASREIASPTGRGSDAGLVLHNLPPGTRAIHVNNKVDLLNEPQRRDVDIRANILTSAVTGAGLRELVDAIGRMLVPQAPAAGEAVAFTAGQIAALEAALGAARRGELPEAEAALKAVLAGGGKPLNHS